MTREEEIKKQAEKKALEPSRLMHPYAKQHKVMSAYEIGFIEGAVWGRGAVTGRKGVRYEFY